MPVTQKDIAIRLGVSRPWVARALGNDPKISDKSRRKVLVAAQEMGYVAHEPARAMAARRHGTRLRHRAIGYISFGTDAGRLLPYAAQIMEGVNSVVSRHGVELLLMNAMPSAGWEKIDGLLVHAASEENVARCRDLGVKVVSLMSLAEGIASVAADEFESGRAATEHLISLGHRRIGYLLDLHVQDQHAVARRSGYLHALTAANISFEAGWIGNLRIDSAGFLQRGRDSMREWLERDFAAQRCTALLVQNDRAAIGVMEALHAAGISIPDQLSIIGCDSTDECEIVRPALTSVRMPLREVGTLGAEALLRIVNEEPLDELHRVLPVGLDVRESTSWPATK